jgi:prepilin peptidase CpaA
VPPKPLFFPDPAFGWVFAIVLIGLTAVAAVTDTRKAIVPNRLTVATLLIGLVMNALRGGWLGGQGRDLWLLPTGSVWVGAADGLLFALAGFAAAFGLMLVFWLLGLCGGGDVKLFAAVGGWVGWQNFLMLWLVSLVVLYAWVALRMLNGGLTASKVARRAKSVRDMGVRAADGSARPRKLRITYSLPIAVATAVVVLWVFRAELQLTAPKAPEPQGNAHVSPRLPS